MIISLNCIELEDITLWMIELAHLKRETAFVHSLYSGHGFDSQSRALTNSTVSVKCTVVDVCSRRRGFPYALYSTKYNVIKHDGR